MAKTYLATRADVNAKTSKRLLSLNGNRIYNGSQQLSFQDVYTMLMTQPDFVVLVHNDMAYHPNEVTTSSIVFSATVPSNGYIRTDRITMASNGTATETYGEAEKTSSRTDDIANNASNSSKYPSTKGVADYVSANYAKATTPITFSVNNGILEVTY